MSAVSARVAKANAAKRAALAAALGSRAVGSSTSLSASYGLPLSEVQRAMREAGVIDLQWAGGKPLAAKAVEYLLEQGQIRPLDTDLFGDPARGQTLGLASC